jgi:hypothetical protein
MYYCLSSSVEWQYLTKYQLTLRVMNFKIKVLSHHALPSSIDMIYRL